LIDSQVVNALNGGSELVHERPFCLQILVTSDFSARSFPSLSL